MRQYPVFGLVARCLIAVGIVLTLLFSGAAPSDFIDQPITNTSTPTPHQ